MITYFLFSEMSGCLLRLCYTAQHQLRPHHPLLVTLIIMASFVEYTPGVSTYKCVPPCSCAKHNQTLTIDCTGLGLKGFPRNLPLTYEYKLILKQNKLARLESLDYFPRVAYMDLSYNELVSINPHAIDVLHEQIKVLMLHGNRLRHVPQELAATSFKKLEQLTLHQNPLVCDCKSKWVKGWLRNTSHISHKQDIVCTNRNLYGRPIMAVPDNLFPCKLQALERAGTALRKLGNPVVIFIVLIIAIVFMWLALFLLYRFCKTSSEIKWMEGAKWTALVETE